jgi:hypothetical protein
LKVLKNRSKKSSGNPTIDAIVMTFIAFYSPIIIGSVCTFKALTLSRSFKSLVSSQPDVKNPIVKAATTEALLSAQIHAQTKIVIAIPNHQQTFANKPFLNLIGGSEYSIPKIERNVT